MKRGIFTICVATLLSGSASMSSCCTEPQEPKSFVQGGQFKDLILPIPVINGIESEGLWGGDNVVPRDRDNGIEDNTWCYWGGNAMLGKDGRYHIAICRWLESTGHNGWFESEVAHCVSDNPLGPYVVTRTIIPKAHNPEVQPMPDGSYFLHTAAATAYVSDSMDGEWELLGKMSMEPRGFRPTDFMGSNLTTSIRDDKSILMMTKGGDIMISNSGVLGPYKLVSIDNYKRNSGYAEDPVIWRSAHQYHCIYNHAQDRKSGYMRSLDGIHWKNEDGLPYDVSSTVYSDGTVNEWNKFERAKVVQDEFGRAAFLSLAVIDVPKGSDRGGDNHSSKHMIMPLTPESFISIVGSKPITAKTKKVSVRIEARGGLDTKNIDLSSLRFGSDSEVNYGGGATAVASEFDGDDLIVDFKGKLGLSEFDYDFKLIGKTNSGGLVVGYALLPGESTNRASLVTPPIAVKENRISTFVENSGLTTSEPTKAILCKVDVEGKSTKINSFNIPALKPYEKLNIEYELDQAEPKKYHYELIIEGQNNYGVDWCRVDECSSQVTFAGKWQIVEGDQYYMGSEMLSVDDQASATFSFEGSRVAAFGTLDNSFGEFDIYIDGEFVETIRLSWGGSNRMIYQSDVLPYGKHTLEMRVAKYRDSFAKSSIDGFAFGR